MPTQHRSRPRTQDRSTASTGEALRSIFNRNFNVVACINLLVMTAYYLMFVTSTAYARATYGASLSSAGLTAGIMVIGCLIGRFLTGNLLSLCGCRAILFAGLLLYSASIAAFFWVPNLALLFVQRLCMGMGVGIMGTATGTIVAYVVPHQHHGLGISLFSMSTAFALALGPFLGILISQYFSYTVLAQTCLGIGLACIVIFFGLLFLCLRFGLRFSSPSFKKNRLDLSPKLLENLYGNSSGIVQGQPDEEGHKCNQQGNTKHPGTRPAQSLGEEPGDIASENASAGAAFPRPVNIRRGHGCLPVKD